MKKIKVKDEYKAFDAVLDATHVYRLDHGWATVPERQAEDIMARWGALLITEDMPLADAAAHIAADVKEEKKVESDETVEKKVKRSRAKKDGDTDRV